MEHNGMPLKKLANELEDLVFILNPDKPTPIYGDISDYLARQKDDAILPIGFDTYKYMQELCRLARQSSKDMMAFASDLLIAQAETSVKISTYFKNSESAVLKFLSTFNDLCGMLPDARRVNLNELDPFKRAAYNLNNTRKLMEDIVSEIDEDHAIRVTASPSPDVITEQDSTPVTAPSPVNAVGISPAVSESIIKKDEAEVRYLERLYTAAEFIITVNLSPSVRRKYMHVELFESKYSYIKKNEADEAELRKNIKQYTIKTPGSFPYITLVVFVKEFANMILISILSYDGKKTSPEFLEKFYSIKYKTRALMERILGLPKVDLRGSEALAFIRTEIVPLSNAWVKDIIIPMRMSREQYYEEINKMSQFIIGRINKIYALEGKA